MAMLHGRRYLGIDISEEYVDIARQRIKDAQQEMGLLRETA